MKKYYFIYLSAVIYPGYAYAVTDIVGAESWILGILQKLNYLFWLVAILVFIWGVIKFIGNADDSTAREQGKSLMVNGVIAFVVLASVWGIVAFVLQDTFGIFSAPVPYIDSDGNPH